MMKNYKAFVTSGNGIDEPSFVQVFASSLTENPELLEDSIGNYRLVTTTDQFPQPAEGEGTFILYNAQSHANVGFFVYDIYWVDRKTIALKSFLFEGGVLIPASGFGRLEIDITTKL